MNEEASDSPPGPHWITVILAGAVIASLLFGTIVTLQSWFSSAKFSDFDRNWAIVYIVILAVIGFSCWLKHGRPLIFFTSLIFILFLLLNIFNQHTAVTWLLLGWILIISAGLGNITMTRLLQTSVEMSGLEHVIICVSIGLGEIALVIMALGHMHFLYRGVILAALAILTIPTLTLRARISQWVERSLRLREPQQVSDLRFFSLIYSLFLICLLSGLVWALAPNISHDPLRYHLGIPMIYAQEHSINYVPEEFRSAWVHNAEMLYTLALTLGGQPLPSLIHLIFGLLTTGLLFAFGKRMAGTRVGLLAAILFFSIPLVTWETGAADNDLVVTFYALGAAFAIFAWWQESKESWLIMSGLFAGLALGTKLTAVLVLLALFVSLACALIIRYKVSRRSAVVFFSTGLIALLVAVPWFIRDWIWTGNPVFPYLNGIFHSSKWPLQNTLLNFSNYGNGHSIFAFFRLPWDLTVHTSPYMEEAVTGFAGALPLLALPWLYLWHFKRDKSLLLWMLTITTGGTILWFAIGQHLRYLLTLFPFFALLSALNFDAISIMISRHIKRTYLQVFFLVLALSYFAATRVAHMQWSPVPERYPYGVALGYETPQAFLSRAVPVYDAFQFLNRQNDGKHKVLCIGNYSRLYTRSRIFGIADVPYFARYLEDPVKLESAQLSRHDFDFVLVNRAHLRDYPRLKTFFSVFQKGYLDHFAILQFSSHGVYVYRLLDHETKKGSEVVDLISNGGFEEVDANSKPAKWLLQGDVVADRTGNHSHSAQTALDTNGRAWILQVLPVKHGMLYTLGAWMRSSQKNPLARLQIQWCDQNSKILDTEISVDGIDISESWQWNEISATAPYAAIFARVGVRVDAGSQVWVDDFRFLQNSTEIQ